MTDDERLPRVLIGGSDDIESEVNWFCDKR